MRLLARAGLLASHTQGYHPRVREVAREVGPMWTYFS